VDIAGLDIVGPVWQWWSLSPAVTDNYASLTAANLYVNVLVNERTLKTSARNNLLIIRKTETSEIQVAANCKRSTRAQYA